MGWLEVLSGNVQLSRKIPRSGLSADTWKITYLARLCRRYTKSCLARMAISKTAPKSRWDMAGERRRAHGRHLQGHKQVERTAPGHGFIITPEIIRMQATTAIARASR